MPKFNNKKCLQLLSYLSSQDNAITGGEIFMRTTGAIGKVASVHLQNSPTSLYFQENPVSNMAMKTDGIIQRFLPIQERGSLAIWNLPEET
ncbi:MAG: hypothetical protein CL529_08110 [Aequorivita sp.]|nr:hypothetical protein [Aequorivita sp.]